VLIAKYTFNPNWSLTARGEYYDDEHGVIIPTTTSNGFKTAGLSLNIDYSPATNMLFRVEGRSLNSKDDVFIKEDEFKNSNSFITAAFALSF
jgi:hypothetical protein